MLNHSIGGRDSSSSNLYVTDRLPISCRTGRRVKFTGLPPHAPGPRHAVALVGEEARGQACPSVAVGGPPVCEYGTVNSLQTAHAPPLCPPRAACAGPAHRAPVGPPLRAAEGSGDSFNEKARPGWFHGKQGGRTLDKRYPPDQHKSFMGFQRGQYEQQHFERCEQLHDSGRLSLPMVVTLVLARLPCPPAPHPERRPHPPCRHHH